MQCKQNNNTGAAIADAIGGHGAPLGRGVIAGVLALAGRTACGAHGAWNKLDQCFPAQGRARPRLPQWLRSAGGAGGGQSASWGSWGGGHPSSPSPPSRASVPLDSRRGTAVAVRVPVPEPGPQCCHLASRAQQAKTRGRPGTDPIFAGRRGKHNILPAPRGAASRRASFADFSRFARFAGDFLLHFGASAGRHVQGPRTAITPRTTRRCLRLLKVPLFAYKLSRTAPSPQCRVRYAFVARTESSRSAVVARTHRPARQKMSESADRRGKGGGIT